MSTQDLVMSILGVLFCGGLVIRLPAIWTGSAPGLGEEPYSFWPFSRAAWLAVGRVYPLGVAFALPLVVAGILIAVDPAFDDPLVLAALVPLYGIMGIALVLIVRVILYNEPKRLVAPHQRDQLGLLEARRQATQRHRR